MNEEYNNERGINMLKKKLGEELAKNGWSSNEIDIVLNLTLEKFGSQTGIMPVNGMLSAKTVADTVAHAIDGKTLPDIIGMFDTIQIAPAENVPGSFRMLTEDEERTVGKTFDAELSPEARLFHEETNVDEDKSEWVPQRAYSADGSFVEKGDMESIDMIDYTESEDLTVEGQRSRGFLAADFDTTDVLQPLQTTKGKERVIGTYAWDEHGELFITCPTCNSNDAIPMGAGKYMCMECDGLFDVDLLLSDLMPEDN